MDRRPHPLRVALVAVAVGLTAAACGSDDEPDVAVEATTATTSTTTTTSTTATPDPSTTEPVGSTDEESERFPDVLDAAAEQGADGTWTFRATLSSPYDTPERYADAWRILGPDGTELGIRVLAHDHANEQPFTRSLSGVEIPDDVETVTIEGRDLANGWGGATVVVELAR